MENPMIKLMAEDQSKIAGFALGDRQYRGLAPDVLKVSQGDSGVLLKSALKEHGLEMAVVVSKDGNITPYREENP